MKRKLKFKIYKDCLDATQLENEITYLKKHKTDIENFFCYKRNIKNS